MRSRASAGITAAIKEFALNARVVTAGAKGCVVFADDAPRDYRGFLAVDDASSHAHWLFQLNGGVFLPPWGKIEQWLISVQHNEFGHRSADRQFHDVSMFIAFTTLFTAVHLGTVAEVLGLVTWNVSWPAIVVQARLVTIGRQYEEAAADLGANQFQVARRVLPPLLAPAIFASAVLVFSGVIDDFVLVDLLSSSAGNTPMSVIIYSTQHGGNGGPALNGLGSIMLAMSLIIVILGYLGYRLLSRGEASSGVAALTAISGES